MSEHIHLPAPTWRDHARQWGARMALVTGLFSAGAGAAVTTTETPVAIGPHHGTAQVALSNEISADLGPLGSITAKSPAPVGGLKLTLKEMPTDGSSLGATDIANYEALFSQGGIQSTTESVTAALERRALQGGVLAVLGGSALWWMLGPHRRTLLAHTLKSRRAGIVATAALASIGLSGSSTLQAPTPLYIQGNPILEAAGLSNIRTEGKILDTTITKYAPEILKHIREIDAYYTSIQNNLVKAYDAKMAEEQANPSGLSSMVADGRAQLVEWTSDLHCNGGMASIAGALARKTKPLFILDTGDMTMGGTEAERLCVTYLPQAAGDDMPIVIAPGNHDSPDITVRQLQSLGYTVLDGNPVNISGVRLLGDKDVMRSPFGNGIYQWGRETPAQQQARLTAQACAQDQPINILAIHEPPEAPAQAFVGCAEFMASGHLHKLQGPTPFTNSLGERIYTMLNGSTGGAAPGKQTASSKLGQDATIVQLVLSTESKRVIGYREIRFYRDASVAVGDVTELPLPARTVAASANK